MRVLYVLALASLAIFANEVAASAEPRDLLRQLCARSGNGPQVLRTSQVRAIIEAARSDGASLGCSDQTRTAIMGLEPVVQLQDVCSQEAVDEIVAFWQRHVSKGSKHRKDLPKPLREFFLAFGLQASRKCKQLLMSQLERGTRMVAISDKDRELVVEPMRAKVTQIFGQRTRIDNLLVVVEADRGQAEVEKRKANNKVSMNPKAKRLFELVRERCDSKFKPLYDALILPIVRLASIGLNYEGQQSFADQMEAFEQSPLFSDWFAATLACEAGSSLTPVFVPKEKTDALGNQQLITFLDEEDLAELRARTGLTLQEEPLQRVEVDDLRVRSALDDLVLDQTDKCLIDSVAKYKHSISALNKFRLRMFKNLPAILKIYAKQKGVQLGLSNGSKSGERKRLSKFGTPFYKSPVKKFIFLALTIGAITAGTILGILATHGVFAILIGVIGAIWVIIFLKLLVSDIEE